MAHFFAKRIVLGLALRVTLGATASADTIMISDSGVTSVSVATAGLDLSSPADASMLLDRLHHAAHVACRTLVDGHPDLGAWRNYRACKAGALDDAVGTLNAPEVTALYRDQTASSSVRASGRPGDALARRLAAASSPLSF